MIPLKIYETFIVNRSLVNRVFEIDLVKIELVRYGKKIQETIFIDKSFIRG